MVKHISKFKTSGTIRTATDSDVRKRFSEELSALLAKHVSNLTDYNLLALLEPEDSIGTFELDQIYSALSATDTRNRNILLILLSRGGSIEPAYQISKLCKAHSKERFVVVVPRQAKSAATLIALGADEIHMGPLGQLGPDIAIELVNQLFGMQNVFSQQSHRLFQNLYRSQRN
jgi:ClpP class serine protease